MSELVRMGQAPRQQQTAPQPRWLHGANAHFPSHSQPRAWPSSGSTKAGVGTELLESEQQQQQGPVWFESDVCLFPPPLTFHCPEGDNGDTYFEGTVGCEDPRTEVCHHEMTLLPKRHRSQAAQGSISSTISYFPFKWSQANVFPP